MSKMHPTATGNPMPMIEKTLNRPSPALSIKPLTNTLTDVPIIVIEPPKMTA